MRSHPGGPVFIGGLDRSGKTFLRLMLSSHPNISMTRRTYTWTHFYNHYGDLSQSGNFERCLAAMLQHKPIQSLNPDPDRLRREFRQGEPSYARLFALFHLHYAEQIGKPRWGDQLAFVEHYADPIFAAYPNAKMIHLVRHPRQRFEAALNHRRPRNGKVGWDTARWLYSIRLAKRNLERYPDGYKIVQYESLICQPEEVLREILSFLGEDFHIEMLTLENVERFGEKDQEEVDPEGRLKREPSLYSTAPSARPGERISSRQLAFIQAYAGQAMQAFGYPLEPIQLSLREQLLFYFVDWPINLAGMALWVVKKDLKN